LGFVFGAVTTVFLTDMFGNGFPIRFVAWIAESTSVAYFYSLFTLLFTNSDVLFFEASASVLTIFTIGEYLEGRVSRIIKESDCSQTEDCDSDEIWKRRGC
jgi:cation transport ATPase